MTSAPSSGDGLLCCEVGRARFAFRSADVRHVERAEYMRPDRDDHGRIGTLRLGGQHVPVFALGEVLGTTPNDQHIRYGDGHIAVTGDRSALTGWLVDRIARAEQPAAGDIAPLPPLVGPQAASWFEALVWLGDDPAALLLAPHHLNSHAAPAAPRDVTPAFERRRPMPEPEPVAIVFSTTVLPLSETRRFALSGRQIAAIVQPRAPITVPGSHDHVEGVAWWRRSAVPVIDFRAPTNRHTAHSRLLIAQCGSRQLAALVAFAIDAEVVMCRPGADHRALTDVACPPFASGVFDVNGEAVALLDLEALLMCADAALPA